MKEEEKERERGTLFDRFCTRVFTYVRWKKVFVSFLRFSIRRGNWLFNWLFIDQVFYIVIKRVS